MNHRMLRRIALLMLFAFVLILTEPALGQTLGSVNVSKSVGTVTEDNRMLITVTIINNGSIPVLEL